MCTDGQGGITSASKCQVHIQDHTQLIKKLSGGEKKLTGCSRLDEDLLPTAIFTKWHSSTGSLKINYSADLCMCVCVCVVVVLSKYRVPK